MATFKADEWVECNSCHGRYRRLLPDGTEYFHVCPSLSDAEVGAALGYQTDTSTWTDEQRAQVAAAPRVRANARNENLDRAKDQAARDRNSDARRAGVTRDELMIAAGAGVTALPYSRP